MNLLAKAELCYTFVSLKRENVCFERGLLHTDFVHELLKWTNQSEIYRTANIEPQGSIQKYTMS